jgi:hypothetical protein
LISLVDGAAPELKASDQEELKRDGDLENSGKKTKKQPKKARKEGDGALNAPIPMQLGLSAAILP